jgi:hypothetical protein
VHGPRICIAPGAARAVDAPNVAAITSRISKRHRAARRLESPIRRRRAGRNVESFGAIEWMVRVNLRPWLHARHDGCHDDAVMMPSGCRRAAHRSRADEETRGDARSREESRRAKRTRKGLDAGCQLAMLLAVGAKYPRARATDWGGSGYRKARERDHRCSFAREVDVGGRSCVVDANPPHPAARGYRIAESELAAALREHAQLARGRRGRRRA